MIFSRRARWAIAAIAVVSQALAATGQATATLRGREARAITVERADVSGVVANVADTPVLLTWDRVRSLEGADDPAIGAYAAAGEALWRGIERLDRGDPIAALVVLETAFETFENEPGPTARLAADALLTARLTLGEAEASVVPWLHALERETTVIGPIAPRRTQIDYEWGLIAELAPVFVPSRIAARVAADVAADDFERWTVGPNKRLAEVYASALLLAAGQSPPPLDWDPPTEGVRLARAMVEARSNDPRRRAAAREELRAFVSDDARPWVRAWSHAGIGLSLLAESEGERLAGIGHLLVVPSVYGEAQPYLAGVCLAEAAQALADAGRTDDAARLLDTLTRIAPRHPALALPSLRGIRAISAPTQTNGIGS
ncbi:MAG: hypothetical protein AAGH71_07075 [Planctomycetota bacterium]